MQHLLVYLNGILSLHQRTIDGQYKAIIEAATPAIEEPYLLIKTMSHHAVRLHRHLDSMIKEETHLSRIREQLSPLSEDLVLLKTNYSAIAQSELHVIDLLLSNIEKAHLCLNTKDLKALSLLCKQEMAVHHERYGQAATTLQLNGLEKITAQWLKDYGVDLKSTYIVLVGTRGPKNGLIELQYFHRIRARYGLSEANTLSGGVIYSEMLPEQMPQISIPMIICDLERDLASQEVAEGLLGDRAGMYQDVLSKYAKPILDAIEKHQGPSTQLQVLWANFWQPSAKRSSSESECPLHKFW